MNVFLILLCAILIQGCSSQSQSAIKSDTEFEKSINDNTTTTPNAVEPEKNAWVNVAF